MRLETVKGASSDVYNFQARRFYKNVHFQSNVRLELHASLCAEGRLSAEHLVDRIVVETGNKILGEHEGVLLQRESVVQSPGKVEEQLEVRVTTYVCSNCFLTFG